MNLRNIPPTTACKAFYFGYFASLAGIQPYLSLLFDESGVDAEHIGTLMAVLPLTRWIVAPLWGAAADASHRHKLVMNIAMLGMIVSLVMFVRSHVFEWFMAASVCYAVFMSPVVPLADATVMATLGERRNFYTRVRLWGTIGWGVASPVIGWMKDVHGARGALTLSLLGVALMIAMTWPLPMHRLKVQESDRQPFLKQMRALLRDWRWVPFLAVAMLAGLALSAIHNFRFLFMERLGGSGSLMGWSMVSATASEVLMFLYARRLLERWRAMPLLLFAAAMMSLRCVLISYVSNPAWLLALEWLHGPTFGLIWAAGIAEAHALAPKGLQTTAQTLFTGVLMGLAHSVGAVMAGWLMEEMGISMMYRAMGLLVLPGVALMVSLHPWLARRAANHEPLSR